MGWIYLAELGECRSLYNNGLDPWRTVKMIDIVSPFCSTIFTTISLPLLQSGMILEVCQPACFPKLTLSTVASHARTSVLQDMEKAWMASEAAFIGRSIAWPKKSSPSSYLLKTYPLSVPKEAGMSYHRLPRWGTIVDGVLYPLHPLVPAIEEKDGSVWLGTPTTSSSTTGRSKKFRGINKLPTPQEFVNLLPTPQASDHKRGDSPCDRQRNSPHLQAKLNVILGTKNQKINLNWLEWLMGYHAGHTELSASVMQWFLSRRKQRSKH